MDSRASPNRSVSAPVESNHKISLHGHAARGGGGVANGMKKSGTPKKIVIKNLKSNNQKKIYILYMHVYNASFIYTQLELMFSLWNIARKLGPN